MNFNIFYFDTYAFFEMIKGNLSYLKYQKKISIITTKLNLMELYYWLLRKNGEQKAELYFSRFLPFCVEIDFDIIKDACKFRLMHKERKLSYVDCIGYIIAKQRNIRFLTGDKEFENFENVEFVK